MSTTEYVAFDLLGPIKDGFLSAINSAFQSVAETACNFVADIVQGTLDYLDQNLGIDFNVDWFKSNYEKMMWIGILTGLAILIAQSIIAALRKDVSAMGRAVGMACTGILAMYLMLSVVAGVSAMVDEAATYLTGGGGSLGQALGDTIRGLPGSVGWFGALVIGLFYLLFGFVFFLLLVARRLAIYIVAYFLPIYAAGLSGGWTSQMMRRGLEILFALLMAKLAIVGTFQLGAAMTGSGGDNIGSAALQGLSGIVGMIIAIFSPFALLYIISFVDGFVTGAIASSASSARGATRSAAGAAGSAAKSASRAPGNATAAGRAGREAFGVSRSTKGANGSNRGRAKSAASAYREARSVLAQRRTERADGGGFSARARGRRKPTAGAAMPGAGISRHAESATAGKGP